MRDYYNELDPFKARWLRALISEGEIPPGDVDERSIKDVKADDLKGYTQCHFFAGVGVWPYALRRGGWEDRRPLWTGSCPCGPFSLAGKQLGFDDPRHLWPEWFRLIGECRPDRILGEQVASAGAWIDLVSSDLEALGYAFGAPDLAAAGFDGAHIRQRFFWVADADNTERWSDMAPRHFGDGPQAGRIEGYGQPGAGLAAGGVAYAGGDERQQGRHDRAGDGTPSEPSGLRPAGWLGDPSGQGSPLGSFTPDERGAIRFEGSAVGATGPLRGCDWLLCQDAKLRPVEPGSFPLAATTPGRVGLLRGYGDAIDAEAATEFVAAYRECLGLSALYRRGG